MRILNAEDANSVVRKYFSGTRSFHGKIVSITSEASGPDDKGTWTVKGTYVTDTGKKESFVASVTSHGEVRRR